MAERMELHLGQLERYEGVAEHLEYLMASPQAVRDISALLAENEFVRYYHHRHPQEVVRWFKELLEEWKAQKQRLLALEREDEI